MNQAETIIIILLSIIAYFLYQIAKQLSFLTGKRLKFRLPRLDNLLPKKKEKEYKQESRPKLPN